MAIELNLNDLQFILKQIKIGEAHANGAALTEIRLDPVTGEVITDGAMYDANGVFTGGLGFPLAIPDPKTPFGVRTVDGSYNNLVDGRELWGAADQPMPRFFDPNYIDDADGDSFDPDGAFGPSPPITNNDYGSASSVADADPRIISNLVADMSINNPAALFAALVFAESEDPYADLAALLAARNSATADLTDLQQDLVDAEALFQAAMLGYDSGDSTTWDAIQAAGALLTEAENALEAAEAAQLDPEAAFLAMANDMGILNEDGGLVIPNVAPDEGISAPFNAWMTFFGQFFDHGLDLITKGGNGTIYIPLEPDDPLYVEGGHANFMVLTRSTTVLDENGVPTQKNVTTPFVDQNQTYTSHASHQVFLREYEMVGGAPVATGRLLEGVNGGLATWADVKDQARTMLGIELDDRDVHAVPLLRTDAYGEFIRGPNGLPLIVTNIGVDGIPNTADDVVVEGDLDAPVATFGIAVKVANAFLDDIAHNAAPQFVDPDRDPSTNNSVWTTADADGDTGNVIVPNGMGVRLEYDNELLDRHFITGDGRGNENFGLTAVHHVFHSEHNRQTVIQKLKILEEGDLTFVNEWLAVDINQAQLDALHVAMNSAVNKHDFIEGLTLTWDGERIFQAARFATEMQYQHLVFEEFGRKIQPAIDPFVFNSVTDINPAIFAEFANVVYRFGHSMLTDSLPRAFLLTELDGGNYDNAFLETVDEGLIAAFLNPVGYDSNGIDTISHEAAAGAIVRGLTNVRGNAIDEFVVDTLRNNLLGLPLDLAAINIARGRDTGMPTLNQAREQLYAATGQSFLRPYTSWADFAVGLKNPLSVVNFVAAYGTHSALLAATSMAEKRDIAMELVFGVDAGGNATILADRDAFINGTGTFATDLGGMDNVDLWIGGLAEKILLFGGMLGSTFTAVFEAQMEALQDADRFYYLTRTQGLNFLDALENNALSKMIMANTDLADPGPDGIRGTADDIILHHIGIDSFAKYDLILEVNEQYQQDYNPDDPLSKDPNDIDAVLAGLGYTQVMRDMPASFALNYQNYLRYIGGEHVVLGGTSGNDALIGDLGDDAIWGGAGNDFIEGGQGVDLIMGGYGDDVILDEGDEGDFIKGDAGNDVIASSNGLDVLMGGEGKDVVFAGKDDTEVFGGEGDDFIMGGDGVDFLLGNEGDDWIEAGGGFDTTAGDNSELFFNSTILGHDVMFAGSEEHDFDAESGDDIMVQGESVMRNEGMFGFDWVSYQGATFNADADMRIRIFTTEEADILRNRFDKVEALSGGAGDDILRGDDRAAGEAPAIPTVNNTETLFFKDELSQAGLARIEGLRELLGDLISVGLGDSEDLVAFTGGNILLGGAGSDTLQGNGGDDFIDGNAALNVRIRLTAPDAENTAENEIATIYTLKHVFTAVDAVEPQWIGKSLFELLVSRAIVPSQMHIVREILPDVGEQGDVDTAVFNDNLQNDDGSFNYTITTNVDGTTTVAHINVSNIDDAVTGRPLISDGVDTLRNIERLQFLDQTISLTGPTLELNGYDTVTRTWADNFNTQTLNGNQGTANFNGAWTEQLDNGTAGGGQIQIDGGGGGGTNVLRFLEGNVDGASITRAFDLSDARGVSVSFSVTETGVGGGDNEFLEFQFAADGVNFVTLATFDGSNNGNHQITLPFSPMRENDAAIRFRMTNSLDGGETFSVDNLFINADIQVPAASPSANLNLTYVEGQGQMAIASDARIVEDSGLISSARIVLTNALPDDELVVPAALLAGVMGVQATHAVVGSTIVVTLAGEAPLLQYQAHFQAIGFRNNSQNPDPTQRVIEVTVNDGFADSNVARTFIDVVPVDDPVNANNDTIITNVLPGTSIEVPKWALLQNDVDPDDAIDITAIPGQAGVTAVLGANAVTVTDVGALDGSFNYTATGGSATDNANVIVDTLGNVTTTFSETFGSTSYTDDDGAWTDDWVEIGDDEGNTNSNTSDNGQIRIVNNRLEFDVGTDAASSNGAMIQRAVGGLAGQTAATLSYSANPDSMETGEYVRVFFSPDGQEANFVQLNEITGNGGNVNYNHNLTGPFTANATLRFEVSVLNNTSDIVGIDNINISFSGPATAVNGTAGDNILIGDANGSTFDAGTGDDVVLAGDGDDTIVWNANNAAAASNNNSDGRDIIDGGAGTDDTFVINGNTANNVAETYRIYSRAEADAAGLVVRNPDTEIVITRGGTTSASIIAELDNIEEIIVNTDNGNDAVIVIGDFAPTSLDVNTITINGGSGDDIVDFSGLTSAHRIVFRSNGGNDTVVGTVRPQDIIELAPGEDVSGYTMVDNGDGTQTYSNGVHSITYTGTMPPQFQNGPGSSVNLMDDEDIEDLLDIVQNPDLDRDASGYGNNVDNPAWGTAGQQFIRLTDAHFTDGSTGIRQTALTPREISNILSNQDNDGDGIEESIVNAFGGTSLLTFFGQYFDHGLDFVAKGQPGSVYIGDVGVTPVMAPRSNIVPGTGIDPDGIPNNGDEIPAEYVNHASPYVDQNQAYGSHDAITDVLRRWEVGEDGSPIQTAYLLAGDIDASGYALLPTLTDIRDNFRVMTEGGELTSDDISDYQGSGQPLLIDFIPKFVTLPDGTETQYLDLDQIGHYFVTGDGRANENVMLTSIHTIWHRNHNFWVNELKARTNNEWTEEEYFEAARVRNIAEYQRVVFTEFTTAMAGGFGEDDDGEHGFEEYDPTIDASISVEFAQAAYRFGHSMLNETVSYVDENGALQEVSLVQAFLNPAQVVNLGVGNLLAGSVQVEHQAIDEDVVNALRNQLVGRPLDLAALNIFRGRDMGIAPFNSVRTQLYEQTNLSALKPYTGWADFALRNGISTVMLAKLQEAYPDGFDTMDLWIGGLLEKPVAGQLGSTFGYIFLEQLNRLQHGDRLYYLELFDDSLFRDESDVTFADIIARNTGLTGLPENVFDLDGANTTDGDTLLEEFDDDDDDDTVGQDDDDDDDDDTVGQDDDDDDDDTVGQDDDDDDDDDDSDDDDDVDGDSSGVVAPIMGTATSDVLMGTSGGDLIFGMAGVDYVIAGAGADILRLDEGDDFADAGAGNDIVWAGEGDDDVLGGDGNDMLYGEAGDDWISGDAGNDMIDGGAGNDELYGGTGDDSFIGRINDGDDTIDGGAGNDTLDLGSLTEAVHVNLGTGVGGRGHVTGGQSGTDTLYGVENVTTGSGNDTIVASNAVNIMDGGAGEDVFVFGSAAAADGDTILNFEAGDKVDLSGMLAGDDNFTLVTGTPSAGEIAVTHEVREDGEYTVVVGNLDGGDAEFRISITGNHNLTSSDFNL